MELDASVRNQMRGMVMFVSANLACGLGPQLPARCAAVRESQAPSGQRLADEGANAMLVRRLGREKYTQRHDFTG